MNQHNTQLLNIEGIDSSITTYIMLPNTTSDAIEEFSKCPEMNIYMFQTKTKIYVAMTRLVMMHNILRLQEDTTTATCCLLLNTRYQLQEVRNHCRGNCIRKSKIPSTR